jgi:hypothetical protein
MTEGRDFTFRGTARVTVYATVEARDEHEARRILEQEAYGSWRCDQVDGDVDDVECEGGG